MRSVLERLVECRSGFSLSLRKGRTGWIFQSPLSQEMVRKRLGSWCERVGVIHQASGKYFAQPSTRYFERALVGGLAGLAPQRAERMRRFKPFLRRKTVSISRISSGAFLRIALRLDALQFAGNPDSLRRHLGDDFDQIWCQTPLYKIPLTKFQRLVFLRLSAGA